MEFIDPSHQKFSKVYLDMRETFVNTPVVSAPLTSFLNYIANSDEEHRKKKGAMNIIQAIPEAIKHHLRDEPGAGKTLFFLFLLPNEWLE
jgi:hypothetical protein